MMYFRALTGGIAELPAADAQIRAAIDADAARRGWPALHEQLREIDPEAASRINPNDSQRIQRALEVFEVSGKPLSKWQQEAARAVNADIEFIKIALQPPTREVLHARIEKRLNVMLNNGFLKEVQVLHQRSEMTARHPSMRSVGYRQMWEHLDGKTSFDEAAKKALFATRQLAKRQITWLRSESELNSFDPLEVDSFDSISAFLDDRLA